MTKNYLFLSFPTQQHPSYSAQPSQHSIDAILHFADHYPVSANALLTYTYQ